MTAKLDVRALTIRLLGMQIGPAAEIVVDAAMRRAQMTAAHLRTSTQYLVFLRALEHELPADNGSGRAVCTRLWNEMADNFMRR